MKLIVVGARGLLGTNIIPLLEKRFTVIPLDIEDWDISDEDAGEKIVESYKPHIIVNLAAFTNVDNCELREDSARAVNVTGAGNIAKIASRRNIPFVHFSTDYVFDGTKGFPYREDDVPNPRSVYGKTKFEGECLVKESHPSPLIIRIQWLYGKGGDNFITKVMKIARENGVLTVVNDQRGSPTYAHDIASPLISLLLKQKTGIYHVANSGSCTWYEFAREIFSQMHIDVDIRPTSSSLLNMPAPRPAYSVFDCQKLFRDTGLVMRPWQSALKEYLSELK